MRAILLVLIIAVHVAAADSPVIAVVGGSAITLRTVEDELLKREGAEMIEKLVHQQVQAMDWAKLDDDDALVQMAGWRLPRRMLVAQLLATSAGKVREELINIALVQQGLAKQKIEVDQAAIDQELARMQRRLNDRFKAKAQAPVDLSSYIQGSENMSLKQFTEQPGIRMMIGLHLLAERHALAQLGEAEIARWFDAHQDHYAVSEAVELSTIFIPFEQTGEADGKTTVAPEKRQQLISVMDQLYADLHAGRQSFARTFVMFSHAYEPYADKSGRIGWVGRDGKREESRARTLPKEVVEAAFAAAAPFPALLPPIVHADGIDIVQVTAHRAAKPADLAANRQEVVQDLIDTQIDEHTKAVMANLRRTTEIDYAPGECSLPDLIRQRQEEAGIPADRTE